MKKKKNNKKIQQQWSAHWPAVKKKKKKRIEAVFSREFLPQPPPPLSSWRILADSGKELCNITSCR